MSWNFFGTLQAIYYNEKKTIHYQRPITPKKTQNDDLNYIIKTSPAVPQSNRRPDPVIEELEQSSSMSTEGTIILE